MGKERTEVSNGRGSMRKDRDLCAELQTEQGRVIHTGEETRCPARPKTPDPAPRNCAASGRIHGGIADTRVPPRCLQWRPEPCAPSAGSALGLNGCVIQRGIGQGLFLPTRHRDHMPIRSHPAGLAADGHEEEDEKQQVLQLPARPPQITRIAPSAYHVNLTVPPGGGFGYR